MDPLLLQQQLKNNNQDVKDIYKDLKIWGTEMEQKEEIRKLGELQSRLLMPLSKLQEVRKQKLEECNRAKKEKIMSATKESKKKIMTYADWDKFDADKECEKVDEKSDSSSESLLEDLKDQALIEKEVGNKFVKACNWSEAIKSYTNAIKYYSFDPIFYANRALCFLKTNQMEKAEKDCTVSLKLNNNYVKAYQRRAVAREALNKLEEARSDLLRVLKLEPKNSESKKKIDEITQKIEASQNTVSKLSESKPHSKKLPSELTNYEQSNKTKIELKEPKYIWPSGEVDNIIKAIQKPPHIRSTKPLTRIPVEEMNSAATELSVPSISPGEIKITKQLDTMSIDDVKTIGQKYKKSITIENIEEQDHFEDEKITQLLCPKTSVQFHQVWKQLKNSTDRRGEYLKLVKPKNIPNLFKESLESEVFSEILLTLAENISKESDETYEYLLNLSKIKRFGALTMFLSSNDKNSLWKMFNYMKEFECRSKEEIDMLILKYEL